jgi:hypothetical protein
VRSVTFLSIQKSKNLQNGGRSVYQYTKVNFQQFCCPVNFRPHKGEGIAEQWDSQVLVCDSTFKDVNFLLVTIDLCKSPQWQSHHW